jgi:hypothetical protein
VTKYVYKCRHPYVRTWLQNLDLLAQMLCGRAAMARQVAGLEIASLFPPVLGRITERQTPQIETFANV